VARDYYYAGGEKIPIARDIEHVAIDLSHEVPDALRSAWLRVKEIAQRLPGNVGLARVADVPAALEQTLEEAGALHPVYRHDGTTLVVLPEVRVEADATQRRALLAAIDQGTIPASVEHAEGEQIVLRPGSGKSALAVANLVHERLHPRMAQARFMRIVPHLRTQR